MIEHGASRILLKVLVLVPFPLVAHHVGLAQFLLDIHRGLVMG
jgi:hypothetical protein